MIWFAWLLAATEARFTVRVTVAACCRVSDAGYVCQPGTPAPVVVVRQGVVTYVF